MKYNSSIIQLNIVNLLDLDPHLISSIGNLLIDHKCYK